MHTRNFQSVSVFNYAGGEKNANLPPQSIWLFRALPQAYMSHVLKSKEVATSTAEMCRILREQTVAFNEELVECGPLTC